MKKNYRLGFTVFYVLAALLLVLVIFLRHTELALLAPKGLIALKEKNLMLTATLLMLIVVIPVFILTFTFAWKYRAGNETAEYTPDWDHHLGLELIWWAIPAAIISILAVVTWNSSHQLDPFQKLSSSKKPITIQVVALRWRWLFIYPDQNIATVNYVQFPADTPVNFQITSDAPMNSFWIPQLGGQIYAMAGMNTQLNLIADKPGTFQGSSANLSGQGFSGMRFTAKATSSEDFKQWVELVRQTGNPLSMDAYTDLAKPSTNTSTVYFSSHTKDLYQRIIDKYMLPANDLPSHPAEAH